MLKRYVRIRSVVKLSKPFSLRTFFKEEKIKDKGIELEDEPTKPSADETNNTASTIATAKQIDSDQTHVIIIEAFKEETC